MGVGGSYCLTARETLDGFLLLIGSRTASSLVYQAETVTSDVGRSGTPCLTREVARPIVKI